MSLPLQDRIDEVRAEFPATARMGYFNTGTIGPIPRRVLEVHQSLERRYHLAGPLDREAGDRVDKEYTEVRPKVASMLRTTPDRIALVENTTTGINAALLSHRWQPGDEVLTSDIEHPAVLVPLEYLRQRYGVVIRRVATRGGVLRTDDLSAAIGPNSRAIAISHVSFSTGGRFPVDEICLLARERSLLSVIDGAQSVGAIPVDLSRLQCDYYAFPGYKWTLGPQGTAGLFVSERAPEVFPYRVALHAVAERFPEGGFRLHADARRFEGTATTAKMEFISLGGSIDLLAGYGWDAVFRRVAGLCEQFRAGVLTIPGAELITPRSRDEAAGLIAFRVAGRSAAEMDAQLYRQGMVVRTVGGNGLRASFHLYNTPEEVDGLLDAIRDLVA
ncbi:MAG: aminotransferase class V-fold PLP-dependent enzyme [Bacillota bacterium]|nr:aminotransferase class V-fold PLP-dependent enzyme [Bacillota bacterium]